MLNYLQNSSKEKEIKRQIDLLIEGRNRKNTKNNHIKPVVFKTKELADKKEPRDCCKKFDTCLDTQIK